MRREALVAPVWEKRVKMPACELLSMCPYFNDSTYGMPEMFKERYCKGDYAWCGRYMTFKALEGELKRVSSAELALQTAGQKNRGDV